MRAGGGLISRFDLCVDLGGRADSPADVAMGQVAEAKPAT
jgi:hypothetical protein